MKGGTMFAFILSVRINWPIFTIQKGGMRK